MGEKEVIVTKDDARLEEGTLAGSILSLDLALRNLMMFTGCSLADALPTITSTPAKLLNIADQRGTLLPGLYADLVFLTDEFEVALTIVDGEIVYTAEGIEL